MAYFLAMDAQQYFEWMAQMLAAAPERGRFSAHVQFVYPAPELQSKEEARRTAARIIDEIGGSSAEVPIEGGTTGVGRGASGVGVALEVIGVVAEIGGAVATLVGAAKGIAALWKRLFTRKGPPMLSIGAATMLCIADLANRETDLTNVIVLHAADVSGNLDMDHTGLDLFLMIFVRPLPGYAGEGDLWLYAIDSYGKLVYRHTTHHEALYHLGLLGPDGWEGSVSSRKLPSFLLDAETELGTTNGLDDE